MIEIESAELAKVNSGVISKPSAPVSIGQLEHRLLARYPRADAESWDRMGLIAGDPAALVSGVLVALDPTVSVIRAAEEVGANVVLTHHPAFLDAPAVFSPPSGSADAGGIAVWEAVSRGIVLMNFHTALDVSEEAVQLLPSMLSLDFQKVLLPLEEQPKKGYGQLCRVRPDDGALRLEQLAARCVSVFGCPPRVWGAPNLAVRKVVVANGSAGNVVDACLRAEADCLICGEVRYHAALDAAQRGLAIIELGHDVSELPLTALLAQAAVDCGVPKDKVSIFEQPSNWTTPEATRL